MNSIKICRKVLKLSPFFFVFLLMSEPDESSCLFCYCEYYTRILADYETRLNVLRSLRSKPGLTDAVRSVVICWKEAALRSLDISKREPQEVRKASARSAQ